MRYLKTFEFYSRLMASGVWFLASSGILLCIVPFRWKNPSLAAVFSRILYWGAKKILNVKVEVENQSRLYTNQPCVYVANHQSNLDIFTISSIYPYRTVVIGKKELQWVPIFGLFFVGSGHILINRSSLSHSLSGLENAKNYILEKNISVWMFPEGTRNYGRKEMLPFKKGAFHLAIAAQIPIVPVVHEPLNSYFDADEKRVGGRVRMRVLEPITTLGKTPEDVPALIEETYKKMSQSLEEMRPKAIS